MTETITEAVTVRVLCKHHHMGDWPVGEFVSILLTEAKEAGAITDFEYLASSRTQYMEVGIFAVDLTGVVDYAMTFEQGAQAAEAYMESVFHDEVLVEGLYGLTGAK